MPDTRTPARTDATGRIIRDWDDERTKESKSCGDLEIAYANASGQEFIAKQGMERARIDLANKQHRLGDLLRKYQRESKTGTDMSTAGGIVGGALGAYIAGRAGFAHNALSGITGMMLGAGEGSGVLSTLATLGEESRDEISGSGSQITLEIELATTEKGVEEALRKLEEAEQNYIMKKETADQAFRALSACRRNERRL